MTTWCGYDDSASFLEGTLSKPHVFLGYQLQHVTSLGLVMHRFMETQ